MGFYCSLFPTRLTLLICVTIESSMYTRQIHVGLHCNAELEKISHGRAAILTISTCLKF